MADNGIDALARDKRQYEKEVNIVLSVLGQQALNEHNPPEVRGVVIREMKVGLLRLICNDLLRQ